MRTSRLHWIAWAGLALGTAAYCRPCLGGVSTQPMTGYLEGRVIDASDSAVAGVDIRLFVGGRETARSLSGDDGSYRLTFDYELGTDETALVWWITPRSDLVSEMAILRESARDRALGLWSPCVPRIGWDRSMSRSVQMLGPAERTLRLRESGCAQEWTRGRDRGIPTR